MSSPASPVTVIEVRVLEGPNLYFPRPAIKIIAQCPGYLEADDTTLRQVSRRLGMRGVRPGAPGSEQRQRAVMRLVGQTVRRIAAASGTTRLGVRTRTGQSRDEVVVAFPWRWRGRGLALGESLGPALSGLLDPDDDACDRAFSRAVALVSQVSQVSRVGQVGQVSQAAVPGRAEHATMVRPKIPVASVTGTNGKTTTTRLIAHMGMTAGLVTAWSATDGVVAQGVMVEQGDYSGPAGGRMVLATPGVQLGILETARGGMLLKGMGISVNDVAVVTNVSADHLGEQGIETLDQLAEVKAIVTKITKPTGWVVLNGDDPRVWAMRMGIKARPWVFSLDSDSPALRESLGAGGRAITVLDGDLVVLEPHADPCHLVPVLDVPMTFAGLSEHNIANALAGTAAALGLGLPRDAVVRGLRTFAPDPQLNPGRMNVYSLPLTSGGTTTVIIDFAHNEAGLEGLLRVAEGLRPPGSAVHLGLGSGGDRTDEILQSLGELGGRRADRVSIVHKEIYLRGREMADLEAHLRIGLGRVGVAEVDSHSTELDGLRAMVETANDGDVLAIMVHADRLALHDWLIGSGATIDFAADIRRKVIASRGEHESEAAMAQVRAQSDPAARIAAAQTLVDTDPADPRLIFELATAYGGAGHDQQAGALYDKALGGGLREPHRHRALLQKAIGYRTAGDLEAARQILDALALERPGSAAVTAFRALTMLDQGQAPVAVAELVNALLSRSGDPDDEAYRGDLHRDAGMLHHDL